MFSQNFISFSELILFKLVILGLSKELVIIYRRGGPLSLNLLRCVLDKQKLKSKLSFIMVGLICLFFHVKEVLERQRAP